MKKTVFVIIIVIFFTVIMSTAVFAKFIPFIEWNDLPSDMKAFNYIVQMQNNYSSTIYVLVSNSEIYVDELNNLYKVPSGAYFYYNKIREDGTIEYGDLRIGNNNIQPLSTYYGIPAYREYIIANYNLKNQNGTEIYEYEYLPA